MKIIFINQYVTHLFVDIINDFAANDHEAVLLTGGIHSSQTIDDSVHIKKFIGYRRKNTFWRLLTWHLFGIRVFFYLLFQKHPVILATNPPFLPIIAWWYHKIKKQPFHVIYYDLYPDALVRMGYIRESNSITRAWKNLNIKVNRDASTVFTISNRIKSGLKEYTDDKKKIQVINPWTDNALIKPVEKLSNQFVKTHNLNDKFIVLYSGNLGITHSIESLLQVVYHMKDYSEIEFVIIGEGSKKKTVENFVAEKNLKNILILPWQPQDQLPFTFPAADIGVITLGKGAEGLSVPSKTYDYLAAGCALLAIADKESELGTLIEKYKCGGLFDPDDVEGISDFILRMKNDTGLLKEYKERSRIASFDFGKENAGKFYEIICSKEQDFNHRGHGPDGS